MKTGRVREKFYLALHTRTLRLPLGRKALLAAIIGAIVVLIGIWVSPTNPLAGGLVGVAGVLGAVLGVLIQPEPLPRDLKPEASGAVRGLVEIAESIENVQRLTAQISTATTSQRVLVALITAHDDLATIRAKLFRSMSEWDLVAPGATEEVKRLHDAGQKAFQRLSRSEDVE